jgi:hypothetical protein
MVLFDRLRGVLIVKLGLVGGALLMDAYDDARDDAYEEGQMFSAFYEGDSNRVYRL